MSIQAQGPDEENGPLVIPPSGRLDLTFEQLGQDTVLLRNHDARQVYRFDIPGNFQISPADSYLDLVMTYFPRIPERSSQMNISYENQLAATIPFTGSAPISDTWRVALPDNSIHLGRNTLAFALNTGGSCEDPGARLDVSLDKGSVISFNYQQVPYPTNLGLYPFPFTENSLLEIPTTIILPNLPTANDLSAAATIAAGLGQRSGNINLTAVTASELDPDVLENNHLIIIGTPDNNALLTELELPLDIDEGVIEPGFGVLEEVVSPWNEFRVVLVVSGLDDEGIGKASIALNRRAYFLGMQGPVAIIVELGNLPLPSVFANESFKLDALGYSDEVIYGGGPRSALFEFSLPLGWQLEAPPFFHLKFSHADIIDPDSSVIDVSLNNVPLGSTLMTENNRDNGELIVALPTHLLKPGRNQLRVAVDMHLPGLDRCAAAEEERAWTVISSLSEIFLPYTVGEVKPGLDVFPFPFSTNLGIEQTYFVLPDQPNGTIVNQLIQLSNQLGNIINTEKLAVPVVFASEVDDELLENNHLILIGRPTENALFAEVNDILPHPFIPNTNILQPLKIDNVVFLADPERHAGFLQIAESPWNETYTLLVITGTTDEGTRLAAEALTSGNRRVSGNLAVIEPALDLLISDPEAVSIYAMDTREDPLSSGTVQTFQGENTLSGDQEIGLSERWWK